MKGLMWFRAGALIILISCNLGLPVPSAGADQVLLGGDMDFWGLPQGTGVYELDLKAGKLRMRGQTPDELVQSPRASAYEYPLWGDSVARNHFTQKISEECLRINLYLLNSTNYCQCTANQIASNVTSEEIHNLNRNGRYSSKFETYIRTKIVPSCLTDWVGQN